MLKRHTVSFKNAFSGTVWVLKNQPNYKIHLFLSFVALILSFVLRISYFEFLVILILIFLGLVIETVNSAIEATTDAIDSEWREELKIAKDVSASAMLILSIGAFFIACLIFIPKILIILNFKF